MIAKGGDGAVVRGGARAGVVAAALAVAGLTFAADLWLTLGASAAPLYEIAVLVGLWARWRWFAVGAASLVSLLILAEAIISAPYPWGSTAFNRAMTLLAAWTTAFLVVLYKRAEYVVRQREREAEAYLDIVAVAIVATDADGRIALVNRKGAEILGGTVAEITGRRWLDFVTPEHLGDAEGIHARLLAGEAEPVTYLELPVLTAGGARRTIAWRSAVARDAEGRVTGVLSSGEDITERRRAEDAARAQQALARVGQMAAVVAHEVRNPLAGIRGAIEVLSARLPPGESEREAVKAILERIDGLNETTEELLVFARPRPQRRAPVSLLGVLKEAALLLAASREHSGVDVDVEGTDVTIVADARIVKNAFFNLLLNAAQAMGRRGTIRVTIAAVGRHIHVAVADDGPGIPLEWRDRIFEPFFTTRHRGTGLGLAIVKRDVELHGGGVDVDCPPAGGTIVTVTLPLASANA